GELADKEYTIAEGHGLSVAVRPNGTKLWLYRYRFGGKRKRRSSQRPPPRRRRGLSNRGAYRVEGLLHASPLGRRVAEAQQHGEDDDDRKILHAAECLDLEEGCQWLAIRPHQPADRRAYPRKRAAGR